MKKKMLILFIYLLGYFASYQYAKYNLMLNNERWTVGDRNFALCLSFGSWVTVTALGIASIPRLFASDKVANW